MFTLLFTVWLNLTAPPCERVYADPSAIVYTEERDGMSVVYAGTLEAFYSTRLQEWRFYRTDSPYTVPEHATLQTVMAKILDGDTWSLLRPLPPSCLLTPSRQRA